MILPFIVSTLLPFSASANGWYQNSAAKNKDRDKELRRIAKYNKFSGVGPGSFHKFCKQMGKRCLKVKDWEGKLQSCASPMLDGTRIAYCVTTPKACPKCARCPGCNSCCSNLTVFYQTSKHIKTKKFKGVKTTYTFISSCDIEIIVKNKNLKIISRKFKSNIRGVFVIKTGWFKTGQKKIKKQYRRSEIASISKCKF